MKHRDKINEMVTEVISGDAGTDTIEEYICEMLYGIFDDGGGEYHG